MAKKKKDTGGDGSGSFARMMTVANYVAACTNPDLMAAFKNLQSGDQLYSLFIEAVNGEVEGLFRGEDDEVEDSVDTLGSKVDQLAEDLEAFRTFVQGFNNERIFAVLNVVSRNFGGQPIPPPPQTPAPQAPVRPAPQERESKPAAATKKSLRKRFAATEAKDAPVEGAPATGPRESDSKPAAPTMPLRGNGIIGMY